MKVNVLFDKRVSNFSILRVMHKRQNNFLRNPVVFLMKEDLLEGYKEYLRYLKEGRDKELYELVFSEKTPEKIRNIDIIQKKDVVIEKLKAFKDFLEKRWDEIKELIDRAFSFQRYPEEIDAYGVYLPLYPGGYNPNERTIVLYVWELLDDKRVIAYGIHELLHLLFKLNKIKTPFEEEIIDYFAPLGHITKRLGLIDKIIVREDKLPFLRNYDFSKPVWDCLYHIP